MPIGVEDQAILFGAYDNGSYNAATNTAYHYFRKNDPTFKITAKSDFIQFLNDCKNQGHFFNVIQLFAHGDPGGGKLQLGGWIVDNDELDGFKGQGWERSFVPDADVQFNTCHLAASAGGEYFLAQFASTFLQRGGCAHASPNYVGSDFACQGGAYALGSPCTNWVHAEVSAGGLVTLRNATYLKLDVIIARLEQLRLHYSIPLRDVGIRKVDLGDVTTTAREVIPEKIAALKTLYGPAPTSWADVYAGKPPVPRNLSFYKMLLDEWHYIERLSR